MVLIRYFRWPLLTVIAFLLTRSHAAVTFKAFKNGWVGIKSNNLTKKFKDEGRWIAFCFRLLFKNYILSKKVLPAINSSPLSVFVTHKSHHSRNAYGWLRKKVSSKHKSSYKPPVSCSFVATEWKNYVKMVHPHFLSKILSPIAIVNC